MPSLNVISSNRFWQRRQGLGDKGPLGAPCSPRPDGPVAPGTEILKYSLSVIFVSRCLCLCSVGGLILDKTVSDPNFAGMAVFTPVINGEVLASAAGRKERGRRRGREGLCISQDSDSKSIRLRQFRLEPRGCSQGEEVGREPEMSKTGSPRPPGSRGENNVIGA